MSQLAGFFKDYAGKWEAGELKAAVSERIKEQEMNFGGVMNAFRLALVGGSFGPDLFTIAEMLGKEEVIDRINKAVNTLDKDI
jgi:glutamyl-tRNA synthetase